MCNYLLSIFQAISTQKHFSNLHPLVFIKVVIYVNLNVTRKSGLSMLIRKVMHRANRQEFLYTETVIYTVRGQASSAIRKTVRILLDVSKMKNVRELIRFVSYTCEKSMILIYVLSKYLCRIPLILPLKTMHTTRILNLGRVAITIMDITCLMEIGKFKVYTVKKITNIRQVFCGVKFYALRNT